MYVALALMAWGSLAARSPFTYQHARDDWPRGYWHHRLFRLTNVIITTVWAMIFTLGIALNVAASTRPEHKISLAIVLPNALLAPATAVSILLPRWFRQWTLAREIERTKRPFGWKPPVLPKASPGSPYEYDVIVIGAGMGGLTAAAPMAPRGLRTLLVEQAPHVGGFCANFRCLHRRCTFDTGVHDITSLGPHGPVRWLLRELGLDSRLEFVRMQHEYIRDGLRLRVPDHTRTRSSPS